MDLDWLAADFAVLDVLLGAFFRKVEKHRDPFKAVGTFKTFFLFHAGDLIAISGKARYKLLEP